MRRAALAVLLLTGLASGEPPATTAPTTRPVEDVLLTVSGAIPAPMTFDRAALAALPRAEVRVKDRQGEDAVYAGVPVRAILEKAGAPIGNGQLRGPHSALYVVATATDGYRVVYALAEFDADFAERHALLADARDGAPLDEGEGPLRLVLPDEARQARWVRQLTSLEIRAAER